MRPSHLERKLEEEACRRLWAAVLKQAIEDAQNHKVADIVKDEAMGWIRSENQNVGSFEWICSTLDLEPDLLRMMVDNGDAAQTRYILKLVAEIAF